MKNPSKDKVKEWNARYYQKVKGDLELRERRRVAGKRTYEQGREYANAYKLQHPCVVCGNSDPIVLEFHHIDPSKKERGVSELYSYKLESLIKEIEKCVVVCANCHKRIHAGVVSMET
jgi:hypothetical protein